MDFRGHAEILNRSTQHKIVHEALSVLRVVLDSRYGGDQR